MADAANDGLRYPTTFSEFLALMERWHRAREGAPLQGEHPMEALRRTAHELSDVTAMARQVWASAEVGRAAGVASSALADPDRNAMLAAWRAPEPVRFEFDKKKPKPDGFSAYTVLQLHKAFADGVDAALKENAA